MRSLDTWRTNMAAEEFTFTKGHEKGFEKGLAEGRAEGEQNKAIAIAKAMLNKGMSESDIAELTGLRIEDILS